MKLNIFFCFIIALMPFPLFAKEAELNKEEIHSNTPSQKVNDVTIDVTELKIGDKALKLSYDIKNDSERGCLDLR